MRISEANFRSLVTHKVDLDSKLYTTNFESVSKSFWNALSKLLHNIFYGFDKVSLCNNLIESFKNKTLDTRQLGVAIKNLEKIHARFFGKNFSLELDRFTKNNTDGESLLGCISGLKQQKSKLEGRNKPHERVIHATRTSYLKKGFG